MNFELLGEYWHQWLSNKWLTWGVGPALAASLGYYIPALILEILIRLPWLQSSLIRYAPNAPTRLESVKQTQQIVSFSRQIWIATTILLGPTAIANVIIVCCFYLYLFIYFLFYFFFYFWSLTLLFNSFFFKKKTLGTID